MTTLIIVQARLASKRLSRKCLMDIAGHPMIWHVVERAKVNELGVPVVVACPLRDYRAFSRVVRCPVMAWDGGENDVLGRFRWVADRLSADVVVRMTGDCPCVLPQSVRVTIGCLTRRGYLAASEREGSGWPDGTGCEAFFVRDLGRFVKVTRRLREHFTWNFQDVVMPGCYEELKGLPTLSVNTRADLDRVRRIYRHLRPGDYSWLGVVDAARAAGVC